MVMDRAEHGVLLNESFQIADTIVRRAKKIRECRSLLETLVTKLTNFLYSLDHALKDGFTAPQATKVRRLEGLISLISNWIIKLQQMAGIVILANQFKIVEKVKLFDQELEKYAGYFRLDSADYYQQSLASAFQQDVDDMLCIILKDKPKSVLEDIGAKTVDDIVRLKTKEQEYRKIFSRNRDEKYQNIADRFEILANKLEQQLGTSLVLHDSKLTVIPIDDIEIQDTSIGNGGFGQICVGILDGKLVAVKKVLSVYERSPKMFDLFQKEALVWKHLDSPHVVRLWGVNFNTISPYIVMDYCSNGNLFEYVKKYPETSISQKIKFIEDIARGMHHLHSRNVIHADLKADNVLVDEKLNCLVSDFGLSFVKNSPSQSSLKVQTAASRWVAPEKYLEGYKSKKSLDIYAFAMTCYQILTRLYPFHHIKSSEEVIRLVKHGSRPQLEHFDLPEELQEMIQHCWRQHEEERPTFLGVLGRIELVKSIQFKDQNAAYCYHNMEASQMQDEQLASCFRSKCASYYSQVDTSVFKSTLESITEPEQQHTDEQVASMFETKFSSHYSQMQSNSFKPMAHSNSMKFQNAPNLSDDTITEADKSAEMSQARKDTLYLDQLTIVLQKLGSSRKASTWNPDKYFHFHLSKELHDVTTVIPSEIGYLLNITTLNLSGNQLSGNIPPEIGNLINLDVLNLSNNNLEGEIPTRLADSFNLTKLYLQNNALTGKIPKDICNLYHLQILNLSSNLFSGSIPKDIYKLDKLTDLNLSMNNLSGQIPIGLGRLQNLRVLNLTDNCLQGELPPELGYLVNLKALYLNNNSIFGKIPKEFNNLVLLQECYYDQCRILNEDAKSLDSLGLDREYDDNAPIAIVGSAIDAAALVGSTDRNASINNSYQEVVASPDRLIDPYPVYYIQTSESNEKEPSFTEILYSGLSSLGYSKTITRALLDELILPKCKLFGSIPASFGKLTTLTCINLSENKLSGSIPASLCNLTNLTILDLSLNGLTGRIPKEIGNLKKLTALYLYSNRLSSEIPSEIGNLTRLQHLYLHNNELIGPIPKEIGNLSSLELLQIHKNGLSGELPKDLENLTKLVEFQYDAAMFANEATRYFFARGLKLKRKVSMLFWKNK
ncbi:hypothetical protein HK103_005687 [Boothiomyces macroporosus]|uniref:Protein kinase domain-containing protein n=1 Tax=Boothiomyces macroporosus TaxID=261099 RepID=A0AAD5Y349_9FUNG|nr:hypothetical protein HK103_005687 [Boothiomyces macroporosus]